MTSFLADRGVDVGQVYLFTSDDVYPDFPKESGFFVPKHEAVFTGIAADQTFMSKKTLTLLVMAFVLSAETHAFTGTVVDRDTGRPLHGATVSVVGHGSPTLTDSLGAFNLPITSGVELHISHIGYAPETLRVGMNPEPILIRMKPVPIPLPTVDVVREADRAEALARQPAFTTVIEREAFEQQVTSLPEVLDRSAGLKVQSMGGLGAFSTISVRGSSSEQIEVYLDGVLMNAASGGGVNLSNLPLANIGRIEISRGAGQDGNGLGGSVHIKTRQDSRDTKGINASWGSFDTRAFNVMASGQEGRTRYLALADYSASDNNFGFLDNNGTEYNANDDQVADRRNSDLSAVSLLGKATIDLSRSRSLTPSQTLFSKRQGIPGISNNQTVAARFNTTRAMTQLGFEDRFTEEGTSVRATAYFTHQSEAFQDTLGEVGTGRQDNSYRTRTFGLRTKSSTVAKDLHILTIHTDIRRETYDPEARIQLITPLFASRRWTLQSRGTADLGLLGGMLGLTASVDVRHQRSRFSGRNPFAFSPQAPDSLTTRNLIGLRTGARVDVTSWMSAKANIARSRRAPSFFELFGDRGSVVGNTGLKPETAVTWDVGLRGRLRQNWIEAVYFDHRYENLIQFAQTSQASSRPENIGKARVRGLELSAAAALGNHVDVSSNYTLQDSEDRSAVPHLTGNALPGRPRHKASIRTDLRISRLTASYDYAFEDGNFLDQANRRELNSRHIHTASLRVKVRKTIHLGLDARNIADARINDLWGYPLPGRSWFVSVLQNWN